MRSRALGWWYTSLRAIAVVNAALWSSAAVAVIRDRSLGPDASCYKQLLLSGVYVAACAFRSFLPVFDIPRLVLVKSALSSVLLGRSVATVAELCFAAQWAFLLHRAASGASTFVQAVSFAIVPLIALAEGFSWYAVLTTRQLAHALENSLWGLAAAFTVASMLVMGPYRLATVYYPTVAGGAAYVAFIFLYDVPMYWSRWLADQANGRKYLRIADGLVDVSGRWTLSCRWADWKDEVLWMSLYFTFGVWCSIWLVYASLQQTG